MIRQGVFTVYKKGGPSVETAWDVAKKCSTWNSASGSARFYRFVTSEQADLERERAILEVAFLGGLREGAKR
jgi:hypothetical protein